MSHGVVIFLIHVYRYVVLDTPGQIEVFTWSASGMIITETLVSGAVIIVLMVGNF